MLFIAWIDALRRVSHLEIGPCFETRRFFEYRKTHLFCHSRIDRRFVHHDRARRYIFANELRGDSKRFQIRLKGFINWRGNSDNDEISSFEIVGLCGVLHLGCIQISG